MFIRRICFAIFCVCFALMTQDVHAASSLGLKVSSDNKTLEVTFKNQKLELKASKPWTTQKEGNDTYYKVNADLFIGDLKLTQTDAKVGKAGGSFKVSIAPSFGDLSISAGSFEFSLLPGDQIKDPPANAEFSKDEMVMLTSIDNAITLNIGDNTSFSVPGTGNISATLLIEFTKGSFYYEGPIPAIQELAGGIDSFISASKQNDATTMGIGFSVDGDFKFESSIDLYSSAKKAEPEKFSCNVVFNGGFLLADAISVDSDFCLNTKSGKAGLNGALVFTTTVVGLDAEFTIGEGSIAIDKDGVRFGFGKTTPNLNKNLENVLHFVAPMLTAESSLYGYATTKGKFGMIAEESDILNIAGVNFEKLKVSLTSSGLDVTAKVNSLNLGEAEVEGRVTDSKCWLDFQASSKLFGFKLNAPRIKPCAQAEGAVKYAGKIAMLGKDLAVKGLDNVAKKGSATLKAAEDLTFKIGSFTINAGEGAYDTSKKKFNLAGSKLSALKELGDFDFGDLPINSSGGLDTDISIKKKIEYNKKLSISGGSVQVSGNAEVSATLTAKDGSASVSGHLSTENKAKFCVKVKFLGKKTSKCDSVKTKLDQSLSLSTGCFQVSASKKILGTKFSIPTKDICIGKDKDDDGKFVPDEDSTAVVVSLKGSNGKYVYPKNGGNDNNVYVSGSEPNGYAVFIMYNHVPDKEDTKDTCPVYGSSTSFLTYNDKYTDRFLRLDKKENPVDSKSKDSKSAEQFVLESSGGKTSGCISNGDEILLKSRAQGTYWTLDPGEMRLYGRSKKSGSDLKYQTFTIYMESE